MKTQRHTCTHILCDALGQDLEQSRCSLFSFAFHLCLDPFTIFASLFRNQYNRVSPLHLLQVPVHGQV